MDADKSLSALGAISKETVDLVLTAIGNFCICSIAIGMVIEIIVVASQHRKYRQGVDNLLVLLIGGIPIAMPTVLSVTMAIGSHRLSQQVFAKGVDKDTVVLMAARASRLENQDAIDTAIVSMLGDPKEARAGITEVHFLPFNPTDKRTALTYIDGAGNMHRVSKGAPEQILSLAWNKSEIEKRVHTMIDKFAEPGLRSLAVACQIYPVSITIRIVLGFLLLSVFWRFDFPPLMVLLIAILNDGTIMTISKDRVKPSPLPDSWKLTEIFATGVVIGTYLALMTVIFYYGMAETSFFAKHFLLDDFNKHNYDAFLKTLGKEEAKKQIKFINGRLASAVYLQVSTISQALIFVTRSRGWSFTERPGSLLVCAFIIAQLVSLFDT